MRQTRKRNVLLFTTLGIVAVLLLLTDMATGDTYITISKIGEVLTGGECDEMTHSPLYPVYTGSSGGTDRYFPIR